MNGSTRVEFVQVRPALCVYVHSANYHQTRLLSRVHMFFIGCGKNKTTLKVIQSCTYMYGVFTWRSCFFFRPIKQFLWRATSPAQNVISNRKFASKCKQTDWSVRTPCTDRVEASSSRRHSLRWVQARSRAGRVRVQGHSNERISLAARTRWRHARDWVQSQLPLLSGPSLEQWTLPTECSDVTAQRGYRLVLPDDPGSRAVCADLLESGATLAALLWRRVRVLRLR